jgi:hypothetical protein
MEEGGEGRCVLKGETEKLLTLEVPRHFPHAIKVNVGENVKR